MRISDWSSDVCSSDLALEAGIFDEGRTSNFHSFDLAVADKLIERGPAHSSQLNRDRNAHADRLDRQFAKYLIGRCEQPTLPFPILAGHDFRRERIKPRHLSNNAASIKSEKRRVGKEGFR